MYIYSDIARQKASMDPKALQLTKRGYRAVACSENERVYSLRVRGMPFSDLCSLYLSLLNWRISYVSISYYAE